MANRTFCLPAQRKLYKSQRQQDAAPKSRKFVFRLRLRSTLHCGIEVLINIEKDQLLCDFGFVCAKQMKIEKESGETPRKRATANELG